MKAKKRRKKQAGNKGNGVKKKKRRKCGAIPGSKACDKQAKNKGRYCSGCEDNKFR